MHQAKWVGESMHWFILKYFLSILLKCWSFLLFHSSTIAFGIVHPIKIYYKEAFTWIFLWPRDSLTWIQSRFSLRDIFTWEYSKVTLHKTSKISAFRGIFINSGTKENFDSVSNINLCKDSLIYHSASNDRIKFSEFINSEEWSECAARETLEETGLKIKNVSFGTVVNAVVPEEDYHYITIFMKGEIDNSQAKEPKNLEPDKCEGEGRKKTSTLQLESKPCQSLYQFM